MSNTNFNYGPLNASGGTFYSFTNGVNDMTRCLTEDECTMVFTKFVCCDFDYPTNDIPERLTRINKASDKQNLEYEFWKEFSTKSTHQVSNVKYIGEVEASNTVNLDANTYTEVYLTVPVDSGMTPKPTSPKARVDKVEFEIAKYGDGLYGNFTELNRTSNKNFQFNTVILYYVLVSTLDNKVVTEPRIYGVLFVNPYENGEIESYKKYAPNSSNGSNGNSYGLKINFRLDSTENNNGVDITIDENSSNSLNLFRDATSKLQRIIDIFKDQSIEILELSTRVEKLESRMFNVADCQDLKDSIDDLHRIIENSGVALSSTNAIMNMIKQNAKDIQALASGRLTPNLQINTDIINGGDGITIDKSVPNEIKINNTLQSYNQTYVYSDGNYTNEIKDDTRELKLNTDREIYFKLKRGTNLALVYVDSDIPSLGDLDVFIDDTNVKWEKGQAVRLVFPQSIDINGHNINIYTDAQNRAGSASGDFSVHCGTIYGVEFPKGKHIIEIVCIKNDINDTNFYTEILK